MGRRCRTATAPVTAGPHGYSAHTRHLGGHCVRRTRNMNNSRRGFGSLHMPRSRGALSGLLLLILGAWGALIPFIGPYFRFAYAPGQAWVWSTARAWLEVFPGATAAAGGFLLLISGNRATAMFGGWLAVIAGAWFVVGRTLASTLRLGDIGQPLAATDAKRAVIEIAYSSGLGALIV